MYTPFDQSMIWIVLTMLSIAAVTDLRTGLIPNSVVASGAAAGVLVQLFAVVSSQTSIGLACRQMGLGLVLGSVLPLMLYSFGALGGGDVKLFAAIGLCLGPTRVLAIELWSHVIALMFLPIHWLGTGSLRTSLATSGRMVRNVFVPARSRQPIDPSSLTALRLAPSILAAAAWVCLLGGALS